MKITAEPRSDQWNADDFIGGPRTFTIAGVKVGSAEQKYDIELAEGGSRAWRPPLTVLRLLIAAWGDEASVWIGRRVTLYRDPSIRFGADQVGGIRVSHLSDLPGGKPMKVRLTASRGKRAEYSVEPLDESSGPLTVQQGGAIAALIKRLDIGKAEYLALISAQIGREAKATAELTTGEAALVIAAMTVVADEADSAEVDATTGEVYHAELLPEGEQ